MRHSLLSERVSALCRGCNKITSLFAFAFFQIVIHTKNLNKLQRIYRASLMLTVRPCANKKREQIEEEAGS